MCCALSETVQLDACQSVDGSEQRVVEQHRWAWDGNIRSDLILSHRVQGEADIHAHGS